MKPHPIKEMRLRMEVLMPHKTHDEGGGHKEELFAIGMFWAGLSAVGHHKQSVGYTLERRISHKITVRYDARIKSDCSLLHEGRLFKIEWIIDPDERKEFLILLCSEQQKRGTHV